MSLSLPAADPAQLAADYDRLRNAILLIAQGETTGWAVDDAALSQALTSLGQAASAMAEPPGRDGLRDGLAQAAAGSGYVVLVRVDRFEALKIRLGEANAAAAVTVLRDRVLTTLSRVRVGRMARGIIEFVFQPARAETVEADLALLHRALEQPLEMAGERLALAIVIGASPLGGLALSEAVQQAEHALTRAEVEGCKVAVFCEQERADASERLALMRDLREGLAAGQLSVAYQPKLNVRSSRIDSVEALARWRHPVRGAVPPDQFIALAEDTGDIAAITEQVLVMAIHDQSVLAQGGHDVAMHVNLSGRLVADEAFCQWVQGQCGAAAGRIGLEITETAVIADPERALHNLRALAESGIDIAIDDYGSGLSSLAYLKALPAKELKIDKAFVQGLTSSHRDPLIIRSTIDLAHALQMQVTAEGVDDPTAFALLRAMGCDRIQGYLIAPPLELSALQSFLCEQGAQGAASPLGGGALLSLRRGRS